jgi:hypothetical protein
MRKYNYDFRIVNISGDIVTLQYSSVHWRGWKTRNINIVTGIGKEPKYIQKFIKEV